MVLSQLEQLSFAEQIDAAVPYVGNAENTIRETRCHQGSSHSGRVLVLFGIIQNRIVGLLDGFGEQTGTDWSVVQKSVVLDFGCVLPKVGQNGVYSNLTGNFPCGMTTHAV